MAKLRFPSGFLWGSATSSHQVEGNNVHNDWWRWEGEGRVQTRSDAACHHYQRYERDFDLARELNQNAHRYSVEWSRVQPKQSVWSDRELAHYQAVVDALKKRNMEPIVTLHHFTNPTWFSEAGGWENSKSIDWFGDYVEKMVSCFGSVVKYWITINEPMVLMYEGYITGRWPPGKRSFRSAIRAIRNLAAAHVRAYEIVHRYAKTISGQPKVGIAKHMVAFAPCDRRSWKDLLATWLRTIYFNRFLLNALHGGHLLIPGFCWDHLSRPKSMDFIGLNYYKRSFVRMEGSGKIEWFGGECSQDHHGVPTNHMSQMNWESYPQGLFDILIWLKRFRLPILITENGICTKNDGVREQFIAEHTKEMHRAIQHGVDVKGYFYWSLLDNFEWAEGFRPRFGLIEVDYADEAARRVRKSALGYADICKSNTIEGNEGQAHA